MMKLGKTQEKILRYLFRYPQAEFQLRDLIKRKSPLYSELNSLIKDGLVGKKFDGQVLVYFLTEKGKNILEKEVIKKWNIIIHIYRDDNRRDELERGIDGLFFEEVDSQTNKVVIHGLDKNNLNKLKKIMRDLNIITYKMMT